MSIILLSVIQIDLVFDYNFIYSYMLLGIHWGRIRVCCPCWSAADLISSQVSWLSYRQTDRHTHTYRIVAFFKVNTGYLDLVIIYKKIVYFRSCSVTRSYIYLPPTFHGKSAYYNEGIPMHPSCGKGWPISKNLFTILYKRVIYIYFFFIICLIIFFLFLFFLF